MNKVKIAVLSKDSKEIIEILHEISKVNRISNEDISLYYYTNVNDILDDRVDLLLIDTAMGHEETLEAIKKLKVMAINMIQILLLV